MKRPERPGFTVAKLGYSAAPWRVINPLGQELPYWVDGFTQADGRPSGRFQMCGHDTKAEAIAYLGEYAWALSEHLTKLSAK